MDKKEKYYNYILDDLINKTEIIPNAFMDMDMIIVPFTEMQFTEIYMFPFRIFKQYVRSKYGTRDGEEIMLWNRYKDTINNIQNG